MGPNIEEHKFLNEDIFGEFVRHIEYQFQEAEH